MLWPSLFLQKTDECVLHNGTRSKVLLKDLEVKKQEASIDLKASVVVEDDEDTKVGGYI